MEWAQTLTIIATLIGVTVWIDTKHRQDLKESEERWKWLFDWAHKEIDELKKK